MNDNAEDYPLLMEKYPGLKKIPRVNVATRSVPVQKLTGLEKELGFEGIYIKREEFSHDVYGGNKARKFDYQLADVLKKGKKKVVTFGGIGSNQILANAVYCKQFGLESVGFANYQVFNEYCRYNMKLDKYYGSEFHYHKSQVGLALALIWYLLKTKGTYLVWAGASTPLGTIGFVDAAFELKKDIENEKLPEPDYIFVPDGSTGTTAGLTLGCELAGLKTKIFGVLVTDEFVAKKKRVLALSWRTYKLLRKNDDSIPVLSKNALGERLTVLLDFHGGEYGLVTQEGKEAIDLIKKTDDITMDPTYTGKCCSAMIAFIREKKEEIKGKTILIWNTLNIIDHQEEADSIDYHDLPKSIHKFFDGSKQLDERCVKARCCEDEFR